MQAIRQQSVCILCWLSCTERRYELIVVKPYIFHETKICRKNNSALI